MTIPSFKKIRSVLWTFSPSEGRSFLSLFFLGAVVLFNQIQNDVIRAVDAPCYSYVAKNLAATPFYHWGFLTWEGVPYHSNPHMTIWLMAIFIKIFGATTLSALVPIVIVSSLTVALAYFVGRTLLGHSFGLLSGFILIFTPAFIKDGRNPTLEPALMFFLMLTVLFHLRFLKKEGRWNTLAAGLALGGAVLSKGPPAVLAPLAITTFYICSVLFPKSFTDYKMPLKKFVLHVWTVIAISAVLFELVDLWSIVVSGVSFTLGYYDFQLKYTIVNSRGATQNNWSFYFSNFFNYYPWIYFMLLSLPVMAWLAFKKRTEAFPAFILGWIMTLGIFTGFTLITHKGFWYTNIHYASSSFIAAVPLWWMLSKTNYQAYFSRFCMVIAVGVLFFSATFPSLFNYPRPIEQLLERASKEYKTAWNGQKLSNCTELDGWRGQYLFLYYLGVKFSPCEGPVGSLAMINIRTTPIPANATIMIANDPYAIIKR